MQRANEVQYHEFAHGFSGVFCLHQVRTEPTQQQTNKRTNDQPIKIYIKKHKKEKRKRNRKPKINKRHTNKRIKKQND